MHTGEEQMNARKRKQTKPSHIRATTLYDETCCTNVLYNYTVLLAIIFLGTLLLYIDFIRV